MNISFAVNGELEHLDVEPRWTLVDALREKLGHTGTHVGCEQGVCGACTVLMDGLPIRACLVLAVQADGASITTVEGLAAEDGSLHPLQEAFKDHHGLQCGFCTPGMLMTALDLLHREVEPDRDRIREEMSGSICRCTGYVGIVDAVEQAGHAMNTGCESCPGAGCGESGKSLPSFETQTTGDNNG